MHYTITTMEDFNGSQSLKLNKAGNQYQVYFYNKGSSKATSKTFKTIEEAERAFFRIASCFIHGDYSAEDRAKMLLNC